MKAKGYNVIGVGFIVTLLCVVVFCYWSENKEVWFCDEIYSYESANGFEQGWPAEQKGIWMSGEDIERYMAANSEELSLGAITVRLYNDHVPLYFWLFRLISFYFCKGSATIWIGLSINLFFYVLTILLGYFVLFYLTKKVTYAAVLTGLIGISRLMMMQATMLRMYMMLLFAELLLLLAGLWIIKNLERKKNPIPVFVYLYGASIFGFLTHYDYWVFYAITAAVFCSWLLLTAFMNRKKSGTTALSAVKYVLLWITNFVLSLLTTILIFPYCRWNLNKGKGKMALTSIFEFSAEKVEDIVWGFEHLANAVFGGLFPVGLELLVIFLVLQEVCLFYIEAKSIRS